MGINRFLASLLALLVSQYGSAEPAQVELYGHIQANNRVLEKAQRDFRALHDRGHLSTSEKEDYEAYLNRLRERLRRDCTLLLQATAASQPLPAACKGHAGTGDLPASALPGTMQTDDERTATLDAELGRELGVFDEMLLREQERIRAAAAGTGTGESGSGGGGTGNGEGGDGENGDGKDSGEQVAGQDKTSVAESVKGDQQPDKSQGSLGKTHQPAAKDTPADIPDGSDDDLVARQLREAAEKERDPELKKRLWDEYRKYKKGTR